MQTTLSAIRAESPCPAGWTRLTKSLGGQKKYGMDTPLDVSHVIDSNGLDDALWVLANACGEDGKRLCHVFACDVAERVLPIFEEKFPGDTRPRRAIEVRQLWLDGKATDEELDAASDAASDAGGDAGWDAAWSAAWAAARAAARVAARADARADASDAARADASDAARAAAWAATMAAAWAAAGGAAWDAARPWQTQHLRELLGDVS